MATLINGNGNPAIYAQQDADLYNGIMGPRTRILNVGSKMAATIEDANTIAIADGVIITKEGRRVQVDVGNVDEFIIPTGQAGTTRYYIIGYHLYTDGSANQLCETFVQLMANSSETITEDEFREGATEVYVSLYRIEQTGLTLNDPEALLTVGDSVSQIEDDIDDIEGDISRINSDLTELRWTEIDSDTGNGTKTYRQILDALYNSMVSKGKRDITNYEYCLVMDDTSGNRYMFYGIIPGPVFVFNSNRVNINNNNVYTNTLYMQTSNSKYVTSVTAASSTTFSDASLTAVPNGYVIRLMRRRAFN